MATQVLYAPETERALAENERYAATFDRPNLELPPSRKLAILACMDARLTVEQVLGLRTGEAHIIRNAGGLATDDAIRSIVVSQELLGTDEVIVIGHTQCGLEGRTDADIRRRLVERTGREIPLAFGTFADVETSVRAQVDRLRSHPWIRPVPIHGLIFDVETGQLTDVA